MTNSFSFDFQLISPILSLISDNCGINIISYKINQKKPNNYRINNNLLQAKAREMRV